MADYKIYPLRVDTETWQQAAESARAADLLLSQWLRQAIREKLAREADSGRDRAEAT